MANALANLFTNIANSIRSKTGSTEKLSPSEFASQIDSISVGGGGAEGCATVTFMNGDNVLLTRPVYIGDDCPDPVTQGRIETPTKESTAQYNYTQSGWSGINGGIANSNILKNITENIIVYAAYTATVREYTITYYDKDGTTVLNTEQLAYGSLPSYIPSKDGFAFIEWTPAPTVVTGNASYTASWTSVLASGTCGDTVRWSLSTDYALTVSGDGAMYDYEVSADVPWKTYASQIIAVTILDGVTSIGNNAFYQCTNLVDVDIADSVTRIGNRSFYDCSTLTSITLPDSIANMGHYAFYGCTNLTDVHISDTATWCNINVPSDETYVLYTGYGKTPRNLYINGVLATDIVIPDSITNIKQYAFAYCSTLTSVTIPDSVTSIDYGAFKYCTSLESVDIADGVTSIGDYAFDSCASLANITIPDSVTSIGLNTLASTAYYNDTNNWENDVLYVGNHLIRAKTSITGSYTVKTDVKTIAKYAFVNCASLESVSIPDSVVGIGVSAFNNCTNLTSIDINNSIYVSINGVLFDKECTKLITYPAGKIETEFNIPDSVTSIGPYAFYKCTNLTSVTIPDSVTSIDYGAFEYCTSLTSITIPNSITSINEYVFYQCTSLESVTIGSGVTSISRYMFGYCSGLTSITIPDTITHILNNAFNKCTNLTSAVFVDTDGWSVVYYSRPLETPKKIYASDLTTSNAAKLLRSTYTDYIWTKS